MLCDLLFSKNGLFEVNMKNILLAILILASTSISYADMENSLDAKNANQVPQGKIIGYLPGWKTPPAYNELVSAGYTHVIIAFGVFSTIKPGEIVTVFDSISKEYIKKLQDNGIKVLLSIGGASSSVNDTTVNFHQVILESSSQEAFVDSFIQSAANIINTYGFDGMDFDIESGLNSGGTFSKPEGDIAILANIINSLHAKYPNLLLTLTPQIANVAATSGFDATWGNYASLIMQTYESLAWVGIQLYNSGCAYGLDMICYDPNNTTSPDSSVAIATDLLENWPTKDSNGRLTGFQEYIAYLKPSQVVLGYPASSADGMSDGSPAANIPNIKRAIECLRTKTPGPNSCDTYMPPNAYPDLGGVFAWEVTYDKNNNYKFATELFDCVINNICTES
jgi:chitinase